MIHIDTKVAITKHVSNNKVQSVCLLDQKTAILTKKS